MRANRRYLRFLGVGVVVLLLLGGWGLISPPALQSQGWQTLDVHTPEVGGEGEAVIGLGNSILIMGQHHNESSADAWLYKVGADGGISLEQTLPPPHGQLRSGTALAYDGNYVYALLGAYYRDCDRESFLGMDLQKLSWHVFNETPYPQGAGDALVYAEQDGENYLYAFLSASDNQRRREGCRNVPNGFARYNIEEDEWSAPGELPMPWDCTDDGAALAWDGGRYIYALRGADCSDTATQDFGRFDIQNQSWEILSQTPSLKVPKAVDDGGSLIWDGGHYLYAVTGGVGEEHKGTNPKGFYRFDLTDQEWETLESLPCPIGDYVGNRLAFVKGYIFAWQGSQRKSRECGGTAIMRYQP